MRRARCLMFPPCSALVALLVLLASPRRATAQGGTHQHDAVSTSPGSTARLGTISFPTSAPPAAQAKFIEGVLYMHSFEYADARAAFRDAERLAPTFALAYWGEAMTLHHPVWNQQERDSARTILARLAPTAAARAALAPTPREKAWLHAAEVLYGEGSKARRDTLWLREMQRMAAAYPEDDEVQVFTALAWLGLNQGVRSVPDYMRAGAIAQRIFERSPRHPGAAHFVIHSFDDPTHAVLGLRAARAYSGIAPTAAHAQHMTTHIFLALGMWEESNALNTIALEASNGLSGHYLSWLAYGYQQQGRFRAAGELLDSAQARTAAGRARLARAVAQVRAAQVLASNAWSSPLLGGLLDSTAGGYARALNAFTVGIAASNRGDSSLARTAWRRLGAVREAIAGTDADAVIEREQVRVMERLLDASIAAHGGMLARGVEFARAAAELHDSLPVEFGPPAIPLPPYEALGELLLASGRAADAQRAFATALDRNPGRSSALDGLVRAATAVGDPAVATEARAALDRNWRQADARGAPARAGSPVPR